MKRAYLILVHAVAIAAMLVFLAGLAPVPFFDQSGTTLLCRDKVVQVGVAKALAATLGNPTGVLDTDEVDRYFFRDGTSVDYVKSRRVNIPYQVVALKQIVLPFFTTRTPMGEIQRMLAGHDLGNVQIEQQPDRAFPEGSVVLIFADSFRSASGSGFGVIVRKHAFRVGGPVPASFTGWPF